MSQLKNSKLRCPVCSARQNVLHPKTQDVRETEGYLGFVKNHLHNKKVVEVNATCSLYVTINPPSEEHERPPVVAEIVCKVCGDKLAIEASYASVESATKGAHDYSVQFDMENLHGFANMHEGCKPEGERS